MEHEQDPNKCKCTLRSWFIAASLAILVILGSLLLAFAMLVFRRENVYACEDQAPSASEIQALGAPICLRTNVRKQPLCLRAGSDDSLSSSVWCQTSLRREEGRSNWYLWWTPCEKCEAAWMMDDEMLNDDTLFKQPEPNEPESHEIPSSSGENGTSWLKWGVVKEEPWRKLSGDKKGWKDSFVTFEECEGDVDESGIPYECYLDKVSKGLVAGGASLFAISLASLLFYGLYLCPEGDIEQNTENSNDASRGVGSIGGGGGGGKSPLHWSLRR